MPTVRQTFFANGQGYYKGTEVATNDPAIKGRESLFDDVAPQRAERPVEQATAAPGEKRPTKRTAKRSVAKKSN